MFCQNCGAQVPAGARFCSNCGEPFGVPAVPQQMDQPAAPEYPPPERIPWHSRGKLSPGYPGARRISILFIAILSAFQAILFLIFCSIEDSVDAEMLTAQLIGFIPAAVLIVYLFCLDTIEKEPPLLLLKLFLVEGLLTLFVVAYVEMALESIGLLFLDEDSTLFAVIDNLVCVALVEEGFNYLVLKRFTWNHPAFNYRFDGIVYAAVTALGFAAFENFSYVASYGVGAALTRMVSAVPGHCADGILMGIFYGQAKLFEARGDFGKSRRYRFLALLAPIAEHGFYDFFANTGDSYLLFYGYVFLLNAVVFVLVWRLAQKDEAILPEPQFAVWG